MTNSFSVQDKYYMERALDIAYLARGRTSPNPLVGCVIVQNGLVVGEGYHAKAGTPHAEVHALRAAGLQAEGADVYVTLEPCSHHGRTPPCTDALIQAKVRRVYVALQDPNPLVSGQGIKKLKEAGIEVETGLLAEKAKLINKFFLKAISTNLPYVLYKSALTLDGKTAVESGDSKWVTSEESRTYVHELRDIYDVIMVGSNTVLQDNPYLTCRLTNGRNPVKLIVDGNLTIPLDANVLRISLCIVATSQAANPQKLRSLMEKPNVEVWQYNESRYVPLSILMNDIVKRGLNSILLEGGGKLAGKMLEQYLIDKIEFIYAPKLVGSGPSPLSGFQLEKMNQAVRITDVDISRIGEDIKVSGNVDYKDGGDPFVHRIS